MKILQTRGYRVTIDPAVKVTVVILSYKRMQNIRAIVRRVQLCGFVDRVVISNNNPEVDLAPYLDLSDERTLLVQQDRFRGASFRFELARAYPNDYFIFVDDDVFPTPWQLKAMLRSLVSDPGSPRGYVGQFYDFEKEKLFNLKRSRFALRDQSCPVDVIMQIYACTPEHLQRYFNLVDAMGMQNEDIYCASDVILSFSGTKKPICEYIGHVAQCDSSVHPEIASYKRHNFFPYRHRIFNHVRKVARL